MFFPAIYLLKYIITVNATSTITRKVAPPIPQAKKIYVFCLILLEDVFSFAFPNNTAAIEEETILDEWALGEGVTKTKTEVSLTGTKTEVALILNKYDDWNIVVCFLSGFAVGVSCVGVKIGSRWKWKCAKDFI